MKTPAPALTRLAIALALLIASPIAVARSVPAGFEDLVEGQTEQLEISLYGRSAGLVPVLVTLDSVQILEPERTLSALGLSQEASIALLPALSKPLARNSHLSCQYGNESTGCGYIEADPNPLEARAIYDEGAGAVHLFIARQWLPASPVAERFHHISAHSENAFLHQQTLNVSGGAGQRALAVRGVGTLGLLDDAHINTEWNYSQQQTRGSGTRRSFQLDSTYYRDDIGNQHYLQVGRMDRRNLSSPMGGNFSFGMLPLNRFDGVRVGTTQAYLDGDSSGEATPLTVLLARSSRVDAFDGERLLETFYLDAGVNQLDTKRFPFGAYAVTLRIYEDGVFVRSEAAPFEKGGGRIDNDLQWFVQAGRSAERYPGALDGKNSGMAGIRVPLLPGAALTAGLTTLGGYSYGEVRVDLRHVFTKQEVSGSFSSMQGSDGTRGQQHQVSYRRRASWNLYHQHLRGAACNVGEIARDDLGCADSLSGSMALPIAGGSAYLGYTRRHSWRTGSFLGGPALEGNADESQLPPWAVPSAPLVRESQLSKTWQASYSRTQHWREFSVAARAGVWQQHNLGLSTELHDRGMYLSLTITRLQRGDRGVSQRRYSGDVRQSRYSPSEISYSAAQTLRQEYEDQYREISAELRGGNSRRFGAVLGAQLQNRAGQTGVTAARYQQQGRAEMSYSATHSSGFALGSQGLYWGSGNGADSGLIVQVDGTEDLDLTGVAAELQVGGLRRQRLRLGERRLLPLPAYREHTAEVQDASARESIASVRVTGVGGAKPLFLSPGRLLHMPVPIEVTYTFIGKAQDIAGVPLSGARILNAPVAGTGQGGGFVADFPHRESTLFLLQNDQLLQCPLRVREQRSVVFLVGNVSCEPLTVAQLPADIRQQARVTRLLQERALIAVSPQTASAGGTP